MGVPAGEAQLNREALGDAVLYEFASIMRGNAGAELAVSDPTSASYDLDYVADRVREESETGKVSLGSEITKLESAWPLGDTVEVISLIEGSILRLRDSQTGLATTGKGAKNFVQGILEEVELDTGFGGGLRIRDDKNRLYSAFPLVSPRDFQARYEVRFLE